MPITERQLFEAIRAEFVEELRNADYSEEAQAELKMTLERAITNALLRFGFGHD